VGGRQGKPRPLEPPLYRVKLHPKAAKELAALPKEDQRRVRDDIDLLAATPRPVGRAEQIDKDIYRIATGRYRSVYRVLDSDRLVAVFLIGHRRNVYEVLERTNRETDPKRW